MPYIVQEKRNVLDPVVSDLLTALRNLELDDPDKNNTEGNINYIVSVLLNELYTSNYGAMNDAMGLLRCISSEFYNRVAVPYEAQKAHDNGDVYGMGATFRGRSALVSQSSGFGASAGESRLTEDLDV